MCARDRCVSVRGINALNTITQLKMLISGKKYYKDDDDDDKEEDGAKWENNKFIYGNLFTNTKSQAHSQTDRQPDRFT